MFDWLEIVAFLHMPFDPTDPFSERKGKENYDVLATQLFEYFIDEGRASQNGGLFAFAEQECFSLCLADNISSPIE